MCLPGKVDIYPMHRGLRNRPAANGAILMIFELLDRVVRQLVVYMYSGIREIVQQNSFELLRPVHSAKPQIYFCLTGKLRTLHHAAKRTVRTSDDHAVD